MKLGIDWEADRKIRRLVLSWHPLLRLFLVLLALIAVTPITSFIYTLIYEIYYISFWFYHFSFVNARFGGFILLVSLLVTKKGRIADIILSPLTAYPGLKINNLWLRIPIYFAVIIGFGFSAHAFRVLAGFTQMPFAFPTGIFDFLTKTFFGPISEEMYFRFLILYITAILLGKMPAVFISTFFFTISHNLSQPYGLLWAASMGFVNAILTIAYGTLWPAIGTHIINNTVVYFSHPF